MIDTRPPLNVSIIITLSHIFKMFREPIYNFRDTRYRAMLNFKLGLLGLTLKF